MFKNSLFKEHLWISESHRQLLLWLLSEELQDSGVDKFSRHIFMNVNKLISLKNTEIPGASEKCLFPCSYNWVIYFAK